jgi:glycosyltransferase involved in cell wall biosynthesis
MRVLHIYSGNLYGGIERLLATLARHQNLCQDAHHSFALCYDGRLTDEIRDAGGEVVSIGPARASRPLSVWRANRQLARALRERTFDAAVFHATWPLALFSGTARERGLPVVFWQHDAAAGRAWHERWARLRVPDFVICNSEYTRSTLRRLYAHTPAEVIHYPVSPFTGATTGLQDRAGHTVIVQVSRLEPWKGHELHLRALAMLRDVAGWTAWIVGGAQRPSEASYRDRLRKLALDAGIADRVRFLGERRDVREILAAADIHCQPNLGPEPFGITFIEALSAGLPVVTTRLGAAPEIIDDSCGVLVPPADPAALAAALRRLVENPGLRARLGRGGPARAAALCDPKTQLQRLAETLARVAGHPRPSPSACGLAS